jgi:LmbE family N-acetylglucosaminyl deacetylase
LDAQHVAVVVAHPDDETIGLGAQLPRLRGISLVHVTDGAPRSGQHATDHGFASWQAYAAARQRELEAAVALAGVPIDALVSFDIPDQEAAYCLATISRRLATLFHERPISLVLTHAFEGGHPDHDSCAFAVQGACRLISTAGLTPPLVIEMPYYTKGDDGWRMQHFGDNALPETAIVLEPESQRLKKAMLEAHASQKAVLSLFSFSAERFRCAPSYDFTRLPNGGALLYEGQHWGMTGTRWLEASQQALLDLGLVGAP